MNRSLQQHLLPRERILWTGSPEQGIVLRTIDIFFIPFSLMWAAFAFFWNYGVWASGAPLFFKLFGLPFLVAGVYLVIGRLLLDRRNRARTAYAVTDRRALILERGGATSRSFDLGRLPPLELIERKDGSGTIRFVSQLACSCLATTCGTHRSTPHRNSQVSLMSGRYISLSNVRRRCRHSRPVGFAACGG